MCSVVYFLIHILAPPVDDGELFIRIPGRRLVLDLNVKELSVDIVWYRD